MAITKVTTGTIADDSIQSLKNRNLIINGAMQVAQRATQVTGVTSSGYYTCDRFRFPLNALGTWTVDQSTDAPNGFSNSLKVTCTTANASPADSSVALIQYRIEAQNLQSLAFGTADAKSLTLSFWVKSNKTGSASYAVIQSDNSDKLFTGSYTINSADTWEYKTISIPADTAGLINNDNGYGLQIDFWFNSGSNYTGGGATSGWESFDNTKRNSSNLGVGGAVSDYFAITGVQLEVGDVATPFEHESYGENLAKCQRYYTKSYDDDVAPGTNTTNGVMYFRGAAADTVTNRTFNIQFPVDLRSNPTMTAYSIGGTSGSVSDCGVDFGEDSTISATFSSAGKRGVSRISLSSGANSIIGVHFTADAEL